MDRQENANEVIRILKSFGYKVYGNDSGTYGYFTDGKNIGYFEVNYFGYVNLSSVHRPNRISGTGFSVIRDCAVIYITKEVCEECFAYIPNSYKCPSDVEIQSVKKWKDWEEFASKYWTMLNEL